MNQNYITVILCTIVESRIVDYWCRCLHFHSANKSRIVSTLNVVSFTDFRNSVILERIIIIIITTITFPRVVRWHCTTESKRRVAEIKADFSVIARLKGKRNQTH